MSTEQPYTDIRRSPLPTDWYADSPRALAQLGSTLDHLLDNAPERSVAGEIVGLVAPHAGYRYSGPVAAAAFKLVRGMAFERVVVVAPIHRDFVRYPIVTTGPDAYETPVGIVPVDRDAVEALMGVLPIGKVRHDSEHALEIELPFLQRALAGDFRLVPLMLMDQHYGTARQLGEALAKLIQSDQTPTLLVASSDLSHFNPLAEAERLDKVMLDRVTAFDPEGVIRVDEEGRASACGRAAIAAVLVAARGLGATAVDIVRYGTSADAGAGAHQVVGYGAAVIYKA